MKQVTHRPAYKRVAVVLFCAATLLSWLPTANAQLSEQFFGDSIIFIDYELAKTNSSGNTAFLFIHERYRLKIPAVKNTKKNQLEIHFRAPVFSDAGSRVDKATLLDVRLNGKSIETNFMFERPDPEAAYSWEQTRAKHLLKSNDAISVSRFESRHADFSEVILPEEPGKPSNIESLQDYVQLGKDYFHDFGCGECHAVNKNDTSLKTGPNLFSLFQRDARKRTIEESGSQGSDSEGRQFSLNADASYFTRSIRKPNEQLAVGEHGTFAGKTYAPIMPPYSTDILNEQQAAAIYAWLQTLNDPATQGPIVKLVPQSGTREYQPLDDPMLLLVGERTRVQRGPMAGTSGRAIHVGTPEGLNYSFDPRVLAVVKIWQGGFLNMSGEWKNRGGRGLQPGFDAQHINFGEHEYLIAPLTANGESIDFSFKEARFDDKKRIQESLYDEEDFETRRAGIDAAFSGYEIDSRNPTAVPEFAYRIANNKIHIAFDASKTRSEATISLRVKLKTAQAFSVNTELLQNIRVTAGEINNAIWTLPAGTQNAQLHANIPLARSIWAANPDKRQKKQQKLQVLNNDTADLPDGYALESWLAPKDNFGRDLLFEALGLDQAADGTIVVATRTAGIWRLRNKQWQQFAEGTFDSLGVIVEDEKGLVLTVGQKPELTRISDTNGDGIADRYETLFDDFSYHGNYHTYMHGPVKMPDGRYYLALNLAHADDVWGAGGKYMGTFGGYSGWGFMVDASGKAETWVNGLRSPAGMGVGPDGRLWYTENQGEYVGSSKMFLLEKGGFYGHPSGLIDLPGMQPSSTDIAWEKVKHQRKKAALIFPHNRLANSPGHLTWETTKGKFGPFNGQIFVGDQTQSNLIRVVLDGDKGAVALPFGKRFSSGIMRPLFLQDGSLLLGQTGRGWQAQGGQVTALQRVVWQGETPLEMLTVKHQPDHFELVFTRPLTDFSVDKLNIESWRYRDAPDYGSPELDLRKEKLISAELSDDKLRLRVRLAKVDASEAHPEQTDRVYQIKLNNGDKALVAFYTAYED